MTKKPILIVSTVILIILAIILAGWLSVIFSKNTVNNFMARNIPWPVVCTLKGCITSTEWAKYHNLERLFAESTDAQTPSTTDSLSTLTRQKIIKEAFLKPPITRSAAKRYREEILNLKNEDQLKEIMDVSLKEYDELVIMPWLEQESLRQEHEMETTAELFTLLSADKFIIVWPWHLTWEESEGKVIER